MLSFSDFFNFSDDQPITEAIAAIEKLEKTYQRMIGAVEDSNQRLAGDLVAVQSNAEDLLKTVSSLNMGMEKNQKTLAQSSSESEDLVKQYNALKVVQEENVKQISSLQSELIKVSKAKEDVKNKTKAEAGSLDELRQKLSEAEKAYKAMGESTDEAVKEEQLEVVRGLANEYKSVNGALTDAKKGAISAAGSYNELSGRVAEAKKRLKEMEGGLEGNSQEFKDLQKFAKEGTEQLKDFDEEVGDNQRKVGDYAGEISKISPGLGGLISGFDGATSAAKKFIATPIGAILAAIALALGALTAYFKGSIEGQDDFNKVLRVGEAIFETLMDVVEAVGKVLFKAITEPKKTWEAFMELIEPLGDMISFAFSHPLDALKAFGKAIYDNVILRFKAIGLAAEALNKIITSGFTDGWKDLGNAVIQATTGVENGVDKIIKALEPLTEELKNRIALGNQIAALENKLRKDRIADILDDAKTELQATQLLVEAKDKLTFSDEQRFNKLRKANSLLEDQLKGDLDLLHDEIKLQQLIIQQNGETYEERQKLVELQAQEFDMQKQFFQQRKRRQSEEIALIREIEKEMIDSQKRISDADRALSTVRLNDIIKLNNRILADENASQEARIDAIMAVNSAQYDLLEDDKDKQLEIAKEAAMGRVELSAEAIDEIYNQETLSIAARIQLERAAKEALLSEDEAYATETIKITEDFTNKTNELLQNSAQAVEDNVFKVLSRDADQLKSKINTELNDAITALDEQYAAGNISMISFQKQREDLMAGGIKSQLNAQLDLLQEELKLYEGNADKRIKIEEQISQVRKDLSEQTAAQILENEQRLADSLESLQNEATAAASDLFAFNSERNIQGLESQLAAEEEKKNRSIAIAGEDAQAKALIEQDFANKQKEIQKQIAAEKRKQAIFQKALDSTQVIISTAKGVAAAVAESPLTFGLPWSAFVAITGGLQLARILAAPLPQLFKGTQFSHEGLAEISERGREIVVSPSGEASIFDKKTVAYLERGSQVIPNYKTEEILRMANREDVAWQDLVSNGFTESSERMGSAKDIILDSRGIINSVEDMKYELKDAIRSQPQDVYDEKGYRHYENGVDRRVEKMNKRYKMQ